MPAVGKFRKRDRPANNGLRRISESLRSELSWLDLLVGLGASVLLAVVLVGFRYHSIPDYQVGDVASEEVRALQDVTYEDKAATEEERRMAQDRTPAVYDFDAARIARIERDISRAFSAAREHLTGRSLPLAKLLLPGNQPSLLKELANLVGSTLPPDILPILLRQGFSSSLEGKIIRTLDSILRGCIIADEEWPSFLQDQRKGIVVRDNTVFAERPLAEAYMARNRTIARDYLRQYSLEFVELPPPDRSQLLSFLETLLLPNLNYNREETESRRAAAADRVSPVELHLKQGMSIVRIGEVVTPQVVAQLAALRNHQKPISILAQFTGFFLFLAFSLYGLWRYFAYNRDRRRKIRQEMVLIMAVLLAVFTIIRLVTGLIDLVSQRMSADALRGPFELYYIIPFAFGAILVTLLVDLNLGIITSMMVSTLSGLFFSDIYIAAYALMGNLAGVFSVRRYKDRAAILRAGLAIGCVCAAGILASDFLRQERLSFAVTPLRAGFGLVSGALASALASMFLPALESLFKITTDIRLLELSNLNAPILRRLSVEAPGTYHHSLMVGTLAEAAAETIGANALLVRVGAYYHDLGKMLKPEYYVENQVFGINKHEALSPNMSCLIIASHVKDGLELAKEIRLAPEIGDLIPQHHGTRIMTYFYRKALDASNGKSHEIDEVDFRYPGPKPQSREAAILMMADSVEAASRTLTDPSPAQIQGMIDRLVDSILADNQFDECDITLREIGQVKEAFFKILTGLYHRRLDYPGYDFKALEDRSDRTTGSNSSPKHAKAV